MTLRGYIDGIVDGAILGWAFDDDAPERRVEVEVFLDERPVGATLASLRRKDLERHGIGDGAYGFKIPWPKGASLAEHHAICASVPGLGSLPLAEDYIVRDADAEPMRDVVLRATDPPDTDTVARRGELGPVRLLGDGGMLFDAADWDELRMGIGGRPLGEPAVGALASRFTAEAERLRDTTGSQLAVVALPSKARVYPDRLPPSLTVEAERTPGAQIVAALAAAPMLVAVDLGPSLRAARVHGKVMLRSRPQLTWLGAHHAAGAVLDAVHARRSDIAPRQSVELRLLQPEILPAAPSRAHVRVGDRVHEVDLRRSPALIPESDVAVDQSAVRALPPATGDASGTREAVFECDRAPGAVAVVVRETGVDTSRLERMLAEHVRRTVVLPRDASPDLLDAEQPDLVILLVDDRALTRMAGEPR